jgi:hypothetical protein
MGMIVGPVDAMNESDQEIEIETGVIGRGRGIATTDAVREVAQGRGSIEEIVAARIEIGSATVIEARRSCQREVVVEILDTVVKVPCPSANRSYI